MIKKILIGFAIVLAAIQFIPVERTNPEVTADFAANMEVKEILKKACYDCHSNETVWPWYSYISPVKFMVVEHVKDGRRHLNFSNWQQLDSAKQTHIKKKFGKKLKKAKCPLQVIY